MGITRIISRKGRYDSYLTEDQKRRRGTGELRAAHDMCPKCGLRPTLGTIVQESEPFLDGNKLHTIEEHKCTCCGTTYLNLRYIQDV